MATTQASELMFRPAGELAAMVRKGEISARELVDASLERIEALDEEVNAFTHVDAEGARAAADAIGADDERPFAGVPIAIKDIVAVKGWPLTFGSDIFGDFRPGHDSFVVRRLRDAGFVLVGGTNLPEMGIVPTTESRRFGPARNPWNLDHTTGGSSGGSAAAVAAGMVPLAHGSDGGGSIRIPAACCGLVGLKPARGRISRGPDMGDSSLATDGVLTRTVAESAELLDLTAGYEMGDATWAPPPDEPFAESAQREPGRLRIGVLTDSPIDTEVDPLAIQGARDAAGLLESLGHDVDEIDGAPLRQPEMGEVFTTIYSGMISTATMFGGLVTKREPSPELVEALTWAMWERAAATTSTAYMGAIGLMQAVGRTAVEAMSAYDAVLTPALGERPQRIGMVDTDNQEDPIGEFRKGWSFTPFTAICNISGQPAISLPLYEGDDGLPLGVQLIGRPAGEGPLLALASQVEAAHPWADRRAPVAVAG